uniref:Uncharacterized protein n=1 Tax=Fagus sylvatica TaxID=28930 RepID=A0A2N9ITY1_FAGSY
MKEESPIICTGLTTTRNQSISSNPSMSYFKRFTIPKPKIRVKFPKLIVKTMQKRCHFCKDDHSNNTKKWAKKVGIVFSGVMGKKKSVEACSYNGTNVEVHRENGDGLCDSLHERETDNSGINKMDCGDEQPFLGAPKFSLSKSHSLKEVLDTEDEGNQKRIDKVKSSIQVSVTKQKLPMKKFLSFSSICSKKIRMKSIKGKINKENDSCSICDGCGEANSSTTVGVVTTSSFRLTGKQGSSGHLIRVPSKILTTRQKLKVARSLRKKENKQLEQDSEQESDEKVRDEKGDLELCKKRILMGAKCRPLGFSGILRYGKDGILLPEVLPW